MKFGTGIMQAEEELETSDSRLELLQNQAEQQQQVLRSLFQRAEGAEHASKELQTALVRAEDTAATLQQRNNAIELVSLVTSCVAAFLAASAATVYLMH